MNRRRLNVTPEAQNDIIESNDYRIFNENEKKQGLKRFFYLSKRRWWLKYVFLSLTFFIVCFKSLPSPTKPPTKLTTTKATGTSLISNENSPPKIRKEKVIHSNDTNSINQVSSFEAMESIYNEPVLIKGWKSPDDEWQRDNFMKKYGEYTQYIKDASVQPLKDKFGKFCKASTYNYLELLNMTEDRLLFFTNDQEAPTFLDALQRDYDFFGLKLLDSIKGFNFFSAMLKGNYHSFHRHDATYIGLVTGKKKWFFLPPDAQKPERGNACSYLSKKKTPPIGTRTVLQEPGDIIHFPKDWFHATCALDPWTLSVGAQKGNPSSYEQDFEPLSGSSVIKQSNRDFLLKMEECGAISSWTFFNGNMTEYYNQLEKDTNRNPKNMDSIAVHRWIGKQGSTREHYILIHNAILEHFSVKKDLKVLDAGCGLGAGLTWFEKEEPLWHLKGVTLSDYQNNFINLKLPKHKFEVEMKSYDDISENYHVIYSIEAFIHSLDFNITLRKWSQYLSSKGLVVIIDDFLQDEKFKDDEDVLLFKESWLAHSFLTVDELKKGAALHGLVLKKDFDVGIAYDIINLNYHNTIPVIEDKRKHQGWLGGKLRHKLTVQQKISYRLLVFSKEVLINSRKLNHSSTSCAEVTTTTTFNNEMKHVIHPELFTGVKTSQQKMECISGWYCCDKAQEWLRFIEANRTNSYNYLKVPKHLFGFYLKQFAMHLTDFYSNVSHGKFLDIGGTGSTASGMNQVQTKFKHFAGPLEYFLLDSDPAAKKLSNAIVCNIEDCPEALDCSYDVTFSHTVLEHALRPWLAFDTIARITKKGGLSLHLVPFSYQYHATPIDAFRFTTEALSTLLTDRGFSVLDVGYDICTKPSHMRTKIDEHFDTIWLTYIIAKKD